MARPGPTPYSTPSDPPTRFPSPQGSDGYGTRFTFRRSVEGGHEFFLMDAEAGEEVRVEGDPYAEHTLTWSPDSGSLVAYRVVPGYERMVHYVESAPEDRLQPRHSTITYTKPGDALDVRRPVLFHLDDGEQIVVDNRLFPNAYSISSPEWREAGWIPPEVFTATGRDGETEIWGIIVRPSNFDPARDYPVVESIYPGPHDNRIDKIWWNELWMSWPVGPHYEASSNVENAHLLEGKLLLTVGEMDTNVDPASTFQVADALIRADKEFDLVVVPGGGHARGPYHVRKRFDFFVQHLLGTSPPDWNRERVLADADGAR